MGGPVGQVHGVLMDGDRHNFAQLELDCATVPRVGARLVRPGHETVEGLRESTGTTC